MQDPGTPSVTPDQLYLYFPEEEQIRFQLPDSDKWVRLIFEGGTTFQAAELTVIRELKKFAITELQKKNSHLVPRLEKMNDSTLLRFYYDCDEDTDIAAEALRDYLFTILKYEKLSSSIKTVNENILTSGAFYSFGRDNCLRPIIVFNFTKILQITNKYKMELYKEALYFFFDYIINNLMIPGQIENWVFIMDFGDTPVMSMGKLKDALQAIILVSRGNGTRLYKNYWINP